MKRWDDFSLMIQDAALFAQKTGYGLKPYDDKSSSTVGFICEVSHKVWQFQVAKLTDALSDLPAVIRGMNSHSGRHAFCRVLRDKNASVPPDWRDATDGLIGLLKLAKISSSSV